jgi:hypothetical protein
MKKIDQKENVGKFKMLFIVICDYFLKQEGVFNIEFLGIHMNCDIHLLKPQFFFHEDQCKFFFSLVFNNAKIDITLVL